MSLFCLFSLPFLASSEDVSRTSGYNILRRGLGSRAAAQGTGNLAQLLRAGKLSPLPTFLPVLNWAIHSYLPLPLWAICEFPFVCEVILSWWRKHALKKQDSCGLQWLEGTECPLGSDLAATEGSAVWLDMMILGLRWMKAASVHPSEGKGFCLSCLSCDLWLRLSQTSMLGVSWPQLG